MTIFATLASPTEGAQLPGFFTRGLPYMMSGKISDLLTPLVTVTNQLILFLSSAFWGLLSPHPLRTSYMEAPLSILPGGSPAACS